jgi:dethiobiotin synthetase
MEHKIVVTGIGTDVGKTVVSAIIAEALNANYWKPIQAGDLDSGDSITIRNLTSHVNVIPEKFRLSEPMSPHAAAKRDGINIQLHELDIPILNGDIVIEGAGGLMVPLNYEGTTYLELFKKWNLPVVVVSKHYLGSINHTLLTLDALKNANIVVKGIIFIGDENDETESIILKRSNVPMLARIPWTENVDKDFIKGQANNPGIKYNFL